MLLEVLLCWHAHASIWVSLRENLAWRDWFLRNLSVVFTPYFSLYSFSFKQVAGYRMHSWWGERVSKILPGRETPDLCLVWRRAEPCRAWLSGTLVGTLLLAWMPQCHRPKSSCSWNERNFGIMLWLKAQHSPRKVSESPWVIGVTFSASLVQWSLESNVTSRKRSIPVMWVDFCRLCKIKSNAFQKYCSNYCKIPKVEPFSVKQEKAVFL